MKKPPKKAPRPVSAPETSAPGGFSEAGAAFDRVFAFPTPAHSRPGDVPREAFANRAHEFLAARRAVAALQQELWRCEDESKPTEDVSRALHEANRVAHEAEDRFAAEPALSQAELDLKFRAIATAEGGDEKTLSQCGILFETLVKSAFRDLRKLPDRVAGRDPFQARAERLAKPATEEEIARRDGFERLYAKWLAARAAMADADRSREEEESETLDDACHAAERALLTTPAPLDWCLWMKWEALDLLVVGEATSGEWHDRRVIAALGSIKADVVRLLAERD